jgi:hypothetical protein
MRERTRPASSLPDTCRDKAATHDRVVPAPSRPAPTRSESPQPPDAAKGSSPLCGSNAPSWCSISGSSGMERGGCSPFIADWPRQMRRPTKRTAQSLTSSDDLSIFRHPFQLCRTNDCGEAFDGRKSTCKTKPRPQRVKMNNTFQTESPLSAFPAKDLLGRYE